MKKTKGNIFGQKSIGRQYGTFVQVVQQLTILASMLILFFSATSAWDTVLGNWLWQHGINLNFWGFIGIIVGLLLVASFFVWKFLLSSYFSVFNEQFYRHDNPIRKDLTELKKLLTNDLHNLEKRVEKLEKKKGRR